LGASGLAVGLADYAGVVGRGGVAEALRVTAVLVALFALAGFGPARLLLPASLRPYELVWMLPIGACAVTLEMAFFVYAFVPYDAALVLTAVVSVALGVLAWRRDPGMPAGRASGRASWAAQLVPLYIALLIGAIALIPMFRGGFATVIGNGSDAHLAVGTAEFLQSHHPTDIAVEEPVDRVPLVWRSKPPIYLSYAAVASISGLPPYQVIATLAAALLALGGLGFWLLARVMLGAGAWTAAVVLGLLGLNRMVLHTGMHPYFNQTWGYFALAFAIVLAWVAVRQRSLPAAALAAAFLFVLALAYPLALPIPLLAAVFFVALDRRERGLALMPRPRVRDRRKLLWLLPLGVLLAGPLNGIFEKVETSSRVLRPGASLRNWGGDLLSFFPERYFLGVPDPSAAAILVPVMAVGLVLGLRAAPRDVRWGLGAVAGFGFVAALYFRPREFGYYFHFKALAFVAPLIVALAAVGLSRLRWRWASIVVAIVLLSASRDGAAHVLGETYDQLPRHILALQDLDERLPADASVRLDLQIDGRQFWIAYMLHGQPLCSQAPVLNTAYPHVPISRAADYVLADRGLRRPFDASGARVASVGGYALYRLKPGLPGGDRCSREMVQNVQKVR
ncbi:MAG: hypothetical protein H0T43_11000, partial [Solirubrobacterales bacterium]|nr:hypothetical protein [Solirubrobacterales bacterium]